MKKFVSERVNSIDDVIDLDARVREFSDSLVASFIENVIDKVKPDSEDVKR